MKAATRKQLETNTLAEGVNKLMHGGVKSPGAVWVLLGVAVVVGLLYWFLTAQLSAKAADAWGRLWLSQGQGMFSGSEADLKNTAAALGADLHAADSQFDQARQLANWTDPKMAQHAFEGAATKYKAVADKAGSVPEVQLRALVGAAKCHETLGALDPALAFYKSAVAAGEAAKLDQHPLVDESRRKLTLLGSAKGEGREFYTGWPDRLPKTAAPGLPTDRPTAPPLPNFPSLIDPKATGPISTTPGTFVPPTATTPAATTPNFTPPAAPSASASQPAPSAPTKPAETKPAASSPSAPAASAPAPSKPAETKPAK